LKICNRFQRRFIGLLCESIGAEIAEMEFRVYV